MQTTAPSSQPLLSLLTAVDIATIGLIPPPPPGFFGNEICPRKQPPFRDCRDDKKGRFVPHLAKKYNKNELAKRWQVMVNTYIYIYQVPPFKPIS